MNNLITFLDGKKTVIGTILLFVSAFCNQVVVGVWHLQSPIIPMIADTCDWIGMFFGGIGLTHKKIKSKVQPNEE